VVAFAGLDGDEAFFRQDVGGEAPAADAAGVDAERPLAAADAGAGGVPVNDEGRPLPVVGPRGTGRTLGAFAGLAGAVDDLNMGDDAGGLLTPGLAWEKAAVDEDGAQGACVVGEAHRLQKSPVAGAQLADGLCVGPFEKCSVFGAAIGEQSAFVVAEQGDGTVGAREVDDGAAVGASIDQVAEQDEAIGPGEFETAEELGEFFVATVDVADGNDASLHDGGRKLASVGRSYK